VRSIRQGRERLFEFEPRPIEDIKNPLDRVSEQWERGVRNCRGGPNGCNFAESVDEARR
jgi:hypothetical protein